jgi:Domain of unknown function (DUF4402)
VDMRNFLIAAVIAAAAVPAPAVAAPLSNSAGASGRALLLLPLTLTKIDDLDFGTVVSSSTSGTVALNSTSSARTFAGGVTGAGAAGHRAYFGGAGTGGQQVVVVVVPPTQLTSPNGDTVDVLALTLDNGGNPIRTIDPVTRTFYIGVGGILNIAANQPDGVYSATFTVTANYL